MPLSIQRASVFLIVLIPSSLLDTCLFAIALIAFPSLRLKAVTIFLSPDLPNDLLALYIRGSFCFI